MNKLFLLLTSLSLVAHIAMAQDYSTRFGRVTDYELKMTRYEPDTSAVAVVLYEDGYTGYNPQQNNLIMDHMISKKIKILTDEGVDYGNITIDYYNKNVNARENVFEIDATSYNIENGKVVKTKLDKKFIFDEEVSGAYRRVKFSMPNVKAGTVIEYRYRKNSNMLYSVDPWFFQGRIPVVLSKYEIRIPEYLIFSVDMKGYEKVEAKEEQDVITFRFSFGELTAKGVRRSFVANNVPALKDEKFIWSSFDFFSSVWFELKATHFPNDFYKPYSNTWADVDKVLNDDSDFGRNVKMNCPFKNEIIAATSALTSDKEKIEAVFAYVKSRVNWNEKYGFIGNGSREALRNGLGDNAQINMLIISGLKEIGMNAYPVMLSTRSSGRLPLTRPSLDKINTFVVCVQTSDGKKYYLDGSTRVGGINTLPLNMMVDRARIFDPSSGDEKWVDLTKIARNQEVMIFNGKVDDKGLMQCEFTRMYQNQAAVAYIESFRKAKDSTEFVNNFATKHGIEMQSHSIEGNNYLSNTVKEMASFSKQLDASNEFIYLNPLVFAPISKNELTASERKLPIEFNFPNIYRATINIKLPAGYQVAEMPKSNRFNLNEECRLNYIIQQKDDVIMINYVFEMGQILFPQMEYENLQAYFTAVVNKNNEMIVLKRI